MFVVILTWALARTVVWGDTMEGGTELFGNPYSEVVYVQKKPSTTVCFGTVYDETSVFTSGLCEIGDESDGAYQVVEIPADLKSGAKTHEIENVTRGVKWPFDAKMITLKSPGFKLCAKCPVRKALWYKWYRDFNQSAQEHSKTIVYGFGPPLKAAVMEFKTKDADDCVMDYDGVREESWPEIPPRYLFCVYEGPSDLQLSVIGDTVKVSPGITCNDSAGSLIKIDQRKVVGIILKAFCGKDGLAALGIAGYYLMKYRPDKNWVPRTTTDTKTAQLTPKVPPHERSSHSGGKSPPTDRELPPSGRESPPSGRDSLPCGRGSSPPDQEPPQGGRKSPPCEGESPPCGRESPPTKDALTPTCTTQAQQIFSQSTEKQTKKPSEKKPHHVRKKSTASCTSPGIWWSGILFVLSVRQ